MGDGFVPARGRDMIREDLNGDLIFVLHNFLSAEECAACIARSEAAGFGEAPITTSVGFVLRRDVRDNDRVMIDDPELAQRLWQRARPDLPANWFGPWQACGLNERFRFYRYDVGQKFAPHSDGYFERDNGERSQLTFMVYLNDDFEGGTTNFHQARPPLRVRPQQGMALVFAHRQLHEGAPVVRGRKYVLRSDVMYRRLSAT
jgi:predicted 2-oxoglutarate/Fe(II)-dependent dioxygenase YbiX